MGVGMFVVCASMITEFNLDYVFGAGCEWNKETYRVLTRMLFVARGTGYVGRMGVRPCHYLQTS
jgi:hypothetical protein